MTYGTLAVELSIPCWSGIAGCGRTCCSPGVGLHLGIEYSIRVGFFSLAMLTLYLSFLDPDWAAPTPAGRSGGVGSGEAHRAARLASDPGMSPTAPRRHHLATGAVWGSRCCSALRAWPPTASGAGRLLVRTVRVAPPGVDPNGPSGEPSLSADGRYVAFASEASNFGPAVGTARRSNVYVFDVHTGRMSARSLSRSVAASVNGSSRSPSISADGQVVAFASQATNLTPGTSGRINRVYVARRRPAHPPVQPRVRRRRADGDCTQPVVSADGRYVAFSSTADNLVPGDDNAASDVFLVDLRSGIAAANQRQRAAAARPSEPPTTRRSAPTGASSASPPPPPTSYAAIATACRTCSCTTRVTGTTFRVSTSSRGREQNASIARAVHRSSRRSAATGTTSCSTPNATNLVPRGSRRPHRRVPQEPDHRPRLARLGRLDWASRPTTTASRPRMSGRRPA